ncbi:MAG: hypothetical protein QM644_20340, partial [Mobilitalea sp.]
MSVKNSKKGLKGRIVLAVLVIIAIVFNSVMVINYDTVAAKYGKISTKNIDRAYTLAEGTEVNTNLEAEGATLLYNKDNTLPLNESK